MPRRIRAPCRVGKEVWIGPSGLKLGGKPSFLFSVYIKRGGGVICAPRAKQEINKYNLKTV